VRFKVDENLPAEIAEALRASGYAADTVGEEGLSGSSDLDVVAAAASDARILLTLDKGIASQVRRVAVLHHGIVLFRPKSTGRGTALAFVQQHLEAMLRLPIQGRVTVVTENGIRIRQGLT
jgi:predicted nuclease of predicted toxin-antitoxin system